MALQLKETDQGITVPIHAQPGSRRNAISGIHDGRLKIAVTQVAEKGKANQAILKLLSAKLGVSSSQLSLISGETSSRKVVAICGMEFKELKSAIENLLAHN